MNWPDQVTNQIAAVNRELAALSSVLASDPPPPANQTDVDALRNFRQCGVAEWKPAPLASTEANRVANVIESEVAQIKIHLERRLTSIDECLAKWDTDRKERECQAREEHEARIRRLEEERAAAYMREAEEFYNRAAARREAERRVRLRVEQELAAGGEP